MEIPPKPEESRDLRDLCISDVVAKKGDPSLCENIRAQGFKDSCYYKIAKEKDAAALCEKIVAPPAQERVLGEAGVC